jgi:hypothetical protein
MSDDNADLTGDSPAKPPALHEVYTATPVDPFLLRLVDMVNLSTMEIGLTVTVGGAVISGFLVGYEQYYEGLKQEMIADGAPPESPFITQLFSPYQPVKAEEASDGDDPPFPQHLHLKDAHLIFANSPPLPMNRGVWWRIRLAQVDSFIMCVLGL